MRTSKVLHKPEVHQLDLLVTERCNLNCVYCFHKQRPIDMTDEIVEKCINMLMDQFHPGVIFNFFGGEPMLREDFCLKWMERLRKILPNCRFHFTTNGTVYSERLVNDWLIKEPPILQISHDGIHQSKLRGDSELVTKNLKKYLSVLPPQKVTTRLTFTKDTVGDLLENLELFYSMGVRRFAHQADVTNEWTQKNIQEYCDQLDKIYDFMDDHSDLDVIFCDCNRMLKLKRQDRQCSMGRELVSLSADGSIYPCHRAVKIPEFKIGDVFTGKLNRGKFSVLKMSGCQDCDARVLCHQCFLANYEQNGFLEVPVESGCGICKYEYKKLSEKYDISLPDIEYANNLASRVLTVLEDVDKSNKEILGLINE